MDSTLQERTTGKGRGAAPAGNPPLYPVALKIAGEPCLVVGGGPIAVRKTQDLLQCGAQVHVVAPEWKGDFDSLEAGTTIARSTRAFRTEDLDGVRLVVAATDDPKVQETIYREAGRRGIPCNVVDVNHLCSFYVPAVLRRGALSVAVGTEGKFPLLAVALRDRIAALLGPRIEHALERLGEGRALAFERFPEEPEARVAALRRLLSSRAVDLILEERFEEFETHYEEWRESL